MANKKGTCTNCGRQELTIVNAAGHCSTCYTASRDKDGNEKEKALSDVASRLGKKSKQVHHAAPPPPAESVTGNVYSIAKEENGKIYVSAEHNAIAVNFEKDDRHLFYYVQELSKKNRRTPEQQILYILDCNRLADQEMGHAAQ